MNFDGLDPIILVPALAAGVLVVSTHVPLGQQVLKRGIIFIDLAVAQIASLGVLAAHTVGLDHSAVGIQAMAFGAALLGALLLHHCERCWHDYLEAAIGTIFVLASSAAVLLLANDPHGGDHLRDLLVGQILWTGPERLLPVLGLYMLVLAAWFGLAAQTRSALFYILFALSITASVQLVGVYLVFASLIIPALAVRRVQRPCLSLTGGYVVGILGYSGGLALSAVFDLPAGAMIVWTLMAAAALISFLSRPLYETPENH